MIGLIDSGLGGLMILFSLMKKYPHESFALIYDNDYFPYGEKTKEELVTRVNFLLNRYRFSKTIIACNTLSTLKDQFNKPVLDIITPTIKAVSAYFVVGVIASKLCIESGYYQKMLKGKMVKTFYGGDLILAIEQNKGIEEAFFSLDIKDVDCLILGCTHFIFMKDAFRKRYSFPIISQDEII